LGTMDVPATCRTRPKRWLGSVALLAALAIPAFGQSESRRSPIVEAVAKARPSVVSISSEKRAASPSRWPFSPEESQRPRVSGMGTGVIIDERGYILTNQHVVDQVQGIEVQLDDGTTLTAKVLQQDVGRDLAMLKIEAGRPLAAMAIGCSADLMVGETVITIGNAFGYEGTTSVGIVSALNRNVTLSDDQIYRNLIQTDAGINPGNSGGPLINVDGELIGVNVATRAGAQGIGFALPIDDVKQIAAEMISTRRLAGTWHGLISGERRIKGRRQVMLADVQAGSPAEIAGLKAGDEIVRVGDLAIATPLDIERALLDARPGQRRPLVVNRDGHEQSIEIELAALPKPGAEAGDRIWRLLGLKAVPVATEYVQAVSPKLRGGLYVQAVAPGGPAARASIQKGDILVGMHVGTRDLETLQPENLLFILDQSKAARAQALPYYLVRRNVIHQGVLDVVEAVAALSRAE